MPVLAYSPTGVFAGREMPAGLMKWEDGIKNMVHDVRLTKLGPSKTTKQLWKSLQNDGDNTVITNQMAPPVDPGPIDYTYTVGPLLTTEWDQGADYNYYSPSLNGGPSGKAWAGCVPVAMAQVMRYYQHPSSFNWSAMPNQVSPFAGPNEVARLLGTIFYAPQLDVDYDTNGTGARSADISETFKNSTFQYRSSNRESYNYLKVKEELRYNHPVILDGCNNKSVTFFIPRYTQCHAWVCDGYEESSYNGYGYLRFHMNWGWGGDKNGWYSFNNWQITFSNGETRNYQNDNDMIINIRP